MSERALNLRIVLWFLFQAPKFTQAFISLSASYQSEPLYHIWNLIITTKC
jgi:hypothetical protein